MLTQKSIDEIRDIDIESIVSSNGVELKNQGASLKACCPFHDEKTPSFTISKSRQTYKCFGCGKSGDGIQFIMDKLNIDFIEACKEIAQQNNITLAWDFTNEDSKAKEIYTEKEELFKITSYANKVFKENLINASEDAKKDLKKRKYSNETIEAWEIGHSPSKFTHFTKIFIDAGKHNDAIKAGVCATANGSNYDFFSNRLIYPIRDLRGNIATFGGRGYDPKYPKFLNGKDTKIYNKSEILYGLFQNRKAIAKERTAMIVEGYSDVVSLWQNGVDYAVAACGTAFTDIQAKTLRKYADNAILFYDGDSAGLKASFATLHLFLKYDFNVSIIIAEAKEDPDSICASGKLSDYIIDNSEIIEGEDPKLYEDAIFYFSFTTLNAAKTIASQDEAIDKVAGLLSMIKKEYKIELYIKEISNHVKKDYTLLRKTLADRVHSIRQDRLKNEKHNVSLKDDLPEKQVQRKDLVDFGFYSVKEPGGKYGYWFQGKEGVQQLSNFTLECLFLIADIENPKRIFSMENENGVSKIIDLQIEDMISIARFKTRLESNGKFLFDGSSSNMNMLKHKLFSEEKVCFEIKTLGWHNDGFYAFANGIFDGSWNEIDEYGIVTVKEKSYFLPALSSIYKASESSYEYQKKFIHKINQRVGFERWSKLFFNTHGRDNGSIAIMYLCGSLFRDIIFTRLSFFPHLFLFGPPGAGKSQEAESMISLFGERQEKINLSATTQNGFFRKMGQFANSLIWCDEYQNSIDPYLVQALKAAYDGTPYNKGVKSQDNQTANIKIQSAMVLSGQHLPTQDPAMLERCLTSVFKDREYDIKSYDELKKLENDGLTSVIIQILKLRHLIADKFNDAFDKYFAILKKHLKKTDSTLSIKDRNLKNYCVFYTCFAILQEELIFPFDLEEGFKIIMDAIIFQSKLNAGSNDLAQWWMILQTLIDDDKCRENVHFKIQRTAEDNEVETIHIRFSTIHAMYLKEFRQQYGKNGLGLPSLQSYLKFSPEFIAAESKVRIGESNTSAYKFNYDIIQSSYDVSLQKNRYHLKAADFNA